MLHSKIPQSHLQLDWFSLPLIQAPIAKSTVNTRFATELPKRLDWNASSFCIWLFNIVQLLCAKAVVHLSRDSFSFLVFVVTEVVG